MDQQMKEWNETMQYGLECVQGFAAALQKFQNRQKSDLKIREILSKQCPQHQENRTWEKLPVESLNEHYQGIIYAVNNAKEIVNESQQKISDVKLNPFYEARKDLEDLLKQSFAVDQLSDQLVVLEKSLKLIRLDSSEEELFLAETIWETQPCVSSTIKIE